MANPQKENGSFPIANEIAEALMRVNICPYENRVLWVVLRQTYGWKKKEDYISFSQIGKKTGLDRRLAARGMKGLLLKNIVIRKDDNYINKYKFNKDFETWKNVIRKDTGVISIDNTLSSKTMSKLSSKTTSTKNNKYTYTKNTNSLKKISDADILLTDLLIDLMRENYPESSVLRRLTQKGKQRWQDACRKLREIDKRTIEQIEKVIRFSQEDDFWKRNIRSMPTIREKWDRLWMQIKDEQEDLSGWAKRRKENETS